MIASAIGEMAGDAMASVLGFSVGAAHGLFAVGVVHTFKALPELFEGVGKLTSGREADEPADEQAPSEKSQSRRVVGLQSRAAAPQEGERQASRR
jgi:hypothetical protein